MILGQKLKKGITRRYQGSMFSDLINKKQLESVGSSTPETHYRHHFLYKLDEDNRHA